MRHKSQSILSSELKASNLTNIGGSAFRFSDINEHKAWKNHSFGSDFKRIFDDLNTFSKIDSSGVIHEENPNNFQILPLSPSFTRDYQTKRPYIQISSQKDRNILDTSKSAINLTNQSKISIERERNSKPRLEFVLKKKIYRKNKLRVPNQEMFGIYSQVLTPDKREEIIKQESKKNLLFVKPAKNGGSKKTLAQALGEVPFDNIQRKKDENNQDKDANHSISILIPLSPSKSQAILASEGRNGRLKRDLVDKHKDQKKDHDQSSLNMANIDGESKLFSGSLELTNILQPPSLLTFVSPKTRNYFSYSKHRQNIKNMSLVRYSGLKNNEIVKKSRILEDSSKKSKVLF